MLVSCTLVPTQSKNDTLNWGYLASVRVNIGVYFILLK